jgi:hypothetical protein
MEARVSSFLDEVAAWAGAQADVHAVLLLGSQTRVDIRRLDALIAR